MQSSRISAAVVAPYPHSTLEPAFGPLEDADGNLYLMIDLPGLAADGTPRRDAHLEQLERARLVVHCIDATDPEPAADRLARAREGLEEFMPEGITELVVATHADEAEEVVAEADVSIDTETGTGLDDLRARLLAALLTPTS